MPFACTCAARATLGILCLFACAGAGAATLDVRPAPERCGAPAPMTQAVPAAAAARIPDSQAVSGSRDIAWVWLGSPTTRYDHDALGSAVHAGSLHVSARHTDGTLHTVSLDLPDSRVIEDRVPRLADLDGDGRDEIILVESDLQRGAALVVYGLQTGTASAPPALVERARSSYLGTSHRWLNPAGVADFDGDGRAGIAAVTTPHIGGVLTLYRYRPPRLEPAATLPGVTNHRIGTVEQQLSAIVQPRGGRPALIVPGMGLRSLHVLHYANGAWAQLAAPVQLPAPVQRMSAGAAGACATLGNGASLRITLRD